MKTQIKELLESCKKLKEENKGKKVVYVGSTYFTHYFGFKLSDTETFSCKYSSPYLAMLVAKLNAIIMDILSYGSDCGVRFAVEVKELK